MQKAMKTLHNASMPMAGELLIDTRPRLSSGNGGGNAEPVSQPSELLREVRRYSCDSPYLWVAHGGNTLFVDFEITDLRDDLLFLSGKGVTLMDHRQHPELKWHKVVG